MCGFGAQSSLLESISAADGSERNACERACTNKDGCTKGERERESSGEETDGVVEGRFYTDNVQSLCMGLTGATAS